VASLLDLKTDAIETSAGSLTLLEDIEGTTGAVNVPLSGLYQRLLETLAQRQSYIERAAPAQTEERVRAEHFDASLGHMALGIRPIFDALQSPWTQLFFQKRAVEVPTFPTIWLATDSLSDVATGPSWKFRAVETKPAPWLETALEDVARLAALPPNWDGYGSPPIGVKERWQAVRLLTSIAYEDLPAPTIVPVSGGGIQLEWQYCGRELELEIVAGSPDLLFLKVYEDGTTEEDSYPIADLERTRKLLDWLVAG
jgi:hypothetical protein